MKKLTYILSIILIALPSVLACSCHGGTEAITTTEDTITEVITSLINTHWKLQSVNGGALVPNSYISLYFRDQKVLGYSGCNRYGGNYSEEPNSKVKFSDVAFSLLGCTKEINDQESNYIQALAKIEIYSFKDSKLTFSDASGQGLLVFLKLHEYNEDPAKLINTKWRPISIGGQTVEKGLNSTLNFDDKGMASGISGPFAYEFSYQAKGDELTRTSQLVKRVTDSTTSQDEQAANYLDALGMVANYRLTNGQLQLFSMRGDKDTIILGPAG